MGLPAKAVDQGEELAVAARLNDVAVLVIAVGFAIEGGDEIQPVFPLQLTEEAQAMTHAQGIVFLVGNRDKEDVAIEGIGTGGILLRHHHLEGQAVSMSSSQPKTSPLSDRSGRRAESLSPASVDPIGEGQGLRLP